MNRTRLVLHPKDPPSYSWTVMDRPRQRSSHGLSPSGVICPPPWTIDLFPSHEPGLPVVPTLSIPHGKGDLSGLCPGRNRETPRSTSHKIIRTCCACCAPRRRVRSIRRETCSKKGRFQRVWRPGRWERKGRSTWWCVGAAKWKERRSCGGNEACVGSKPRLAVRKHAQERKKGQVVGSGREKARVQVSAKIPLYHSGGVE